ncbi:MAG: GHKL domain-containing protein [Holophagales bacterium]|nr:GHKL domain-containing protein [Holophagales bacterium]MYF97137.1 GHKL domain-containing protein [Holophagales bacterium]
MLADLALFGWLIFRSLSEREVNRVVLEARTEAEELAERIAGRVESTGRDLYTAMATESETRRYIDSVLVQRDIVETVEVFDSEGHLVFRNRRAETRTDGDGPPNLESPALVAETVTNQVPYETVTVPVGTVGTFQIGISRSELQQRLTTLRLELLRQTAIVAVLTMALFVAGYLLYSRLSRRTALAERQAQEAEQMAYVGTLASGLAHEIRSPLNSLNLNMQMLQEEMPAGSSERLVAITRSEVGRLERLVSDFLSYARPDELKLEQTTASELLCHGAEVVAGKLHSAGIPVEIDDRSGGVPFQVDREQMNQLLLNLIDNAVAAMSDCDRPCLRLEAEARPGSVVLAVGDNGPGVDPADRERVFDLFHSGRRGGTGLGLAIVRRIAATHGGEARLRQGGAAGATFEVELPLSPSQPTPARRRAEHEE